MTSDWRVSLRLAEFRRAVECADMPCVSVYARYQVEDWVERARKALREAVILHEANMSVDHTHFAMPHGWTRWEASR